MKREKQVVFFHYDNIANTDGKEDPLGVSLLETLVSSDLPVVALTGKDSLPEKFKDVEYVHINGNANYSYFNKLAKTYGAQDPILIDSNVTHMSYAQIANYAVIAYNKNNSTGNFPAELVVDNLSRLCVSNIKSVRRAPFYMD